VTDARREWIALGLLVLAVLWQTLPLVAGDFAYWTILGTDSYRSHDWLEVAKFDHFARRSLLEEHVVPWWNPLLAGGLPQAAHPSDGSLSPLIIPSLLFGEAFGMKINIVLVALLGTLGVWFLGRRTLDLGIPAAFVAGLAYAWSGWLPARVAVGFYESCLMTAWPAILALWLAPGETTARRKRWCFAALVLWACALQLQLAVPVFVLLMAILWGSQAVVSRWTGPVGERRVPWTLLIGGLLILALAGTLGGIKYLPMLDQLAGSNFRTVKVYPIHPDAWYLDWHHFWYGLFHRVPNVPIVDRDGNPRIQEYMTLLPGTATVLLSVLGTFFVLRGEARGARAWLVVGGVFFWLSFGPHAPVDGFAALRKLPLFGSMRGPLRYLNYPVLLTICLLAGVGFEALHRWTRSLPRARFATGAALAAVVALNLPSALSARTLYSSSFRYAIADLPTPAVIQSERLRGISTGGTDHHQRNLRKYVNVRRGVPTVYLPEDVPIKVSAAAVGWIDAAGKLKPELDYYGEVWAADPRAPGRPQPEAEGSARLVAYRSSEVEIAHDLRAPRVVVVNQNARPGWSCGDRPLSPGTAQTLGLLAFEAPAGSGRTICRWRPRTLRSAVAVSGLGAVGLLVLWPWGVRGRRGDVRGKLRGP
jgi:hypothetical protein